MSADKSKIYELLCDEELYRISMLKQKNGNATPQARAAQREIAKRTDVYHSHNYRNGSSKKYAYDTDYMPFETDNR